MAHSGGFEPPTARFVAGYSIQLSYECTLSLINQISLVFDRSQASILNMAHSGGFEPPTARFVAGYSIQLSYECAEGMHYRRFKSYLNLFL